MKGLLDAVTTSFKTPITPESTSLQLEGTLFAVLDGNLKGEFLVYMEEVGDTWKFFAFFDLPNFHIRQIPKNAFIMGIETGIVERVEELPKDVLGFLKEQYRIATSKT